MAVPNLDRMPVAALWDFSERHNFGREFKELFPNGGMHNVRDTWTLSRIADWLYSEKVSRMRGEPEDITHANLCRFFADRDYATLSPAAQWRKR